MRMPGDITLFLRSAFVFLSFWKMLGLAVLVRMVAATGPGVMLLLTWEIPVFRWPMAGLTAATILMIPAYLMLTSFRPWR